MIETLVFQKENYKIIMEGIMKENIILQSIFFVTMYPVLFIVYFLLRNAGRADKAYIYGATLKKEYRTEGAVLKITEEYKKKLKKATIFLGIMPVVSFFIPYMSINLSFWIIWILVVCFFPMYYGAKANTQLRELKRKRGWYENYDTSYVDLKVISIPTKVNLKTFLIPILGSIIPVFIAFANFQGYGYRVYPWIVATFGACTLLFYVTAIWTDRQKIMVISTNSDVNVNYARAKKNVWKWFWMVCSWINTIFTWFILGILFVRNSFTLALIIGSLVYGLVVMGITVVLVKKINLIEKNYEDKKNIIDAAEDDQNWIFGMVYYNKKDKHYMTQTRFGMGTTVNLAHPAGLLTELIGLLAILSMPIMCVWMIMLEFTPLEIKVENETIVCEQLSVKYEIPLADIVEYKVVTELPKLIKVNGNGMENQLSGTFEVYREGMFRVFLNPKNEIFLYITTEDKRYYLGGTDDAMTKEVIEFLEMR